MISNYACPVNPLPAILADEIVKDALLIAKDSSAPPYVAFDADGTLWLNDASEVFFDYQIEHKLVELPALPWDHYLTLKNVNPPDAFVWLAQVLQGHSVEAVKSWAKASFQERHLLPFEDIKKLLQLFRSEGVEVWVVTASVKWAVEAAVELYELPVTGVLGITTEVSGGLITDVPEIPVTWREGKAQALKLKMSEHLPLFCAGNTPGDEFLLELSQTKPLALQSHVANSPLQRSEAKLATLAQSRGWRLHDFRPN